jgi:hypothetical protein
MKGKEALMLFLVISATLGAALLCKALGGSYRNMVLAGLVALLVSSALGATVFE